MELPMTNKESRVVLTQEQHAALTIAANRAGMALATFLRHCGLEHAAKNGIHAQQPKAD